MRSAGTTYPNVAIHPKARVALMQRGLDSSLIKQFRPRLILDLTPSPDENELIFGMTRSHLQLAREQGALGTTHLLTEVLGEEGEIADPYFEGGFDGVFDHIARCVEALVEATDS